MTHKSDSGPSAAQWIISLEASGRLLRCLQVNSEAALSTTGRLWAAVVSPLVG